MTVDQPLYALAKQIQWTKLGHIDDDHFLVMMGDLHIEMTFMKCIGKRFHKYCTLTFIIDHHLQFISENLILYVLYIVLMKLLCNFVCIQVIGSMEVGGLIS